MKQIKIYMYLPTTVEDQVKTYKGNAFYYSKEAVKENINLIKERNKDYMQALQDELAAVEPVYKELLGEQKKNAKKKMVSIKKELANIKQPKLSDYKELILDYSDVKEIK